MMNNKQYRYLKNYPRIQIPYQKNHINLELIDLQSNILLKLQLHNDLIHSIQSLQSITNLQFHNIISEITQHSSYQLYIQKRLVFVIINHCSQNNLASNMYAKGVRYLMEVQAYKNIRTNIDIVAIQYQNQVQDHIINQTLNFLTRKNIARILHGNTLKLKSPLHQIAQNTPSNAYTLITGGSKGIGYSIAKQLAARKKNLILTGRPGNASLINVCKQLEVKYEIKVFPAFLNLDNQTNISQFIQLLKSQKLYIQSVVHNAGVGTKTSQQQLRSPQDKNKIFIRINSLGPVKLHTALEKQNLFIQNKMINNIFISSSGALRPLGAMNPFDFCSKTLLEGWLELLNTNKYNSIFIYPGGTNTQMFQKSTLNILKQNGKLDMFVQSLPKKILIQPDEIGQIVNFFIGQYSIYYNKNRISACCGTQLDYRPLI